MHSSRARTIAYNTYDACCRIILPAALIWCTARRARPEEISTWQRPMANGIMFLNYSLDKIEVAVQNVLDILDRRLEVVVCLTATAPHRAVRLSCPSQTNAKQVQTLHSLQHSLTLPVLASLINFFLVQRHCHMLGLRAQGVETVSRAQICFRQILTKNGLHEYTQKY